MGHTSTSRVQGTSSVVLAPPHGSPQGGEVMQKVPETLITEGLHGGPRAAQLNVVEWNHRNECPSGNAICEKYIDILLSCLHPKE